MSQAYFILRSEKNIKGINCSIPLLTQDYPMHTRYSHNLHIPIIFLSINVHTLHVCTCIASIHLENVIRASHQFTKINRIIWNLYVIHKT